MLLSRHWESTLEHLRGVRGFSARSFVVLRQLLKLFQEAIVIRKRFTVRQVVVVRLFVVVFKLIQQLLVLLYLRDFSPNTTEGYAWANPICS